MEPEGSLGRLIGSTSPLASSLTVLKETSEDLNLSSNYVRRFKRRRVSE